MARYYDERDHSKHLELRTEADGSTTVWVKVQLDPTSVDAEKALSQDEIVKILTLHPSLDVIDMFPILVKHGSENILQNRYNSIKTIRLEGKKFPRIETVDDVVYALEEMPPGFLKDYEMSVGIQYDYRFIGEQIEEATGAEMLIISTDRNSGFDEGSKAFTLSYQDFEEARKAINRITNRARNASSDVKETTIYNQVASIVSQQKKRVRYRRDKMTKKFQDALQNEEALDDSVHKPLLEIVEQNAARMAKTNPEKVEKLRDELQAVTLDSLIENYELMLAKKHSEDDWQKFFTEHPFILSFVFGYPVVQIESHASVGGKKIEGGGEKIADFLYKNNLTENAALFEIKTPQTALLQNNEYRHGIFAPSKELLGATNQVLDQRYQLQLHFASKVVASDMHDLKSYAIACCVIAGTLPEDKLSKKSFELARYNSKDVEILTFDELLEKLKQLREFIQSTAQ